MREGGAGLGAHGFRSLGIDCRGYFRLGGGPVGVGGVGSLGGGGGGDDHRAVYLCVHD